MNLFILTIATRVVPDLGYLLVSAKEHGLDVQVLGLGDTRMRPGHIEFQIKFEYVKDWLEKHLADGSVQPTDLLVVVDGYDVMVRGGKEDILNAWRAMGEPFILLSGETDCFPDWDKHEFFDDLAEQFPQSPNKYICAGLFAGTAQNVLHALTSLEELNVPGEHDDQRMWTDAFMKHGQRLGMVIDRTHTMLPSINGSTVRDILANKAPFVHFNGKQPKTLMPEVFETLHPTCLQPKVSSKCNMGAIIGVSVTLIVLLIICIVLLSIRRF